MSMYSPEFSIHKILYSIGFFISKPFRKRRAYYPSALNLPEKSYSNSTLDYDVMRNSIRAAQDEIFQKELSKEKNIQDKFFQEETVQNRLSREEIIESAFTNDIVFDVKLHGYNREQVDDYIDKLTIDYNAICKKCDALEKENSGLRKILTTIGHTFFQCDFSQLEKDLFEKRKIG